MSIFKTINIESKVQLNGKYTLIIEAGTLRREFPDLTSRDIQDLSYGILQGVMEEDHRMEEARLLDNTGAS